MPKDFPITDFADVIGKTIVAIVENGADEGFDIELDNGMVLRFGFSGCEGSIHLYPESPDKSWP